MTESGKKALTEEFQNLANSILEDKTKRFSEQNLESLGQVLTPFRERLNEFKSRVEEIHYQDAQQQAALKTELSQLKELNRQMSEEAHDLATALKGHAKSRATGVSWYSRTYSHDPVCSLIATIVAKSVSTPRMASSGRMSSSTCPRKTSDRRRKSLTQCLYALCECRR